FGHCPSRTKACLCVPMHLLSSSASNARFAIRVQCCTSLDHSCEQVNGTAPVQHKVESDGPVRSVGSVRYSMFTGLIEEIGTIKSIERGISSARIEISAPGISADAAIGDSIS